MTPAVWHELRRYLRRWRGALHVSLSAGEPNSHFYHRRLTQLEVVEDIQDHMRHLLARRRKATRRGK